MGLIGKVIESIIKNQLREIRTEIYTNLIKSPRQVLPPGIDAVPIQGDQGVMLVIGQSSGKGVQIGVYPDPQAESGEVRFYSRDDNGAQQAFLWIKKDGNIEINGDADFAVAFDDLKSGFDTLKSDLNSVVSIFNAHLHPFVGLPSGTPGFTAATATPGSSSAANIDASKVDTVKLP